MESEIPSKVEAVNDYESSASSPVSHREEADYMDIGSLFWSAVGRIAAETSFLFRSATLGMLLAALIVFLVPNWYRASTQIIPTDEQNPFSSAVLAAGAIAGTGSSSTASALLGTRSPGSQLIAVLKSHTLEDAIIERFRLQQTYNSNDRERTRAILASNSIFVEDQSAGILNINVTDQKPERAAAIANAYVEELNSMLLKINVTKAHRQRIFLEGRLNEVSSDLQSAEKGLANFSSKNTTLDPAMQGKGMFDAVAGIENELVTERAQLQGLDQVYAAKSLQILSSQARIAELELQLRKMTGGDSDKDKSSLPYPTMSKLSLLGATYSELYRHVQEQQLLFETLSKQYEAAKLEEAEDAPSTTVLDRAEIPGRKAGPPRLLWILIAGILCILLSSSIILIEDYYRSMSGRNSAQDIISQMVVRARNSRLLSAKLVCLIFVTIGKAWCLLRFGQVVSRYQHSTTPTS